MTDERENPNKVTYKGKVVDSQVILTSVQYPSEFIGEDGKVVMACEPVEAGPRGELTFDASEIPFATSPFDEEMRPPEIARDQMVTHTTVGGRGIVGRIK
jgi:hypothetical protein